MSDLLLRQKEELIRRLYADPVLFLRVILPHWFTKPVSWAHRGMLAILLRQTDFLLNFGKEQWPDGEGEWTKRDLAKIIKFFVWKETPTSEPIPLFELEEYEFPGEDEPRYKLHLSVTQFTEIVWPRGFGKTTIINAANIIKICFRMRKFLVYISETATHAIQQMDNVKRELTSNKMLIDLFGVQKPARTDEESWRSDWFETTSGIAVTGRGRGGQVRGLLFRNERPDDVTLDDVEDLESVTTPEQLLKTKTWFKADVEPALNQIKKTGVINVIGTILAREALIPSLIGNPEWVSVVFGALDPDGNPLWPEYMNMDQIAAKKRSYARLGMLAQFYMEFMSTLVINEAAKFSGPFPVKIMTRSEFVGVALVIDPAISRKENADFCAFAVTGITERGQHHVLESIGKKGMNPREQINTYFDLHFKWNPTHHGVEAIAYQRALIHLLKEEMFRLAKTKGAKAYFDITPITHGQQGKIPRVEGILQPRYSAGYISHQRVFPELEEQLLEWPLGKKDFPDAVAMAIALLDPFAATAYDDEPDENGVDALARDHYPPLDDYGTAP